MLTIFEFLFSSINTNDLLRTSNFCTHDDCKTDRTQPPNGYGTAFLHLAIINHCAVSSRNTTTQQAYLVEWCFVRHLNTPSCYSFDHCQQTQQQKLGVTLPSTSILTILTNKSISLTSKPVSFRRFAVATSRGVIRIETSKTDP